MHELAPELRQHIHEKRAGARAQNAESDWYHVNPPEPASSLAPRFPV
jgi:hypothetical protein